MSAIQGLLDTIESVLPYLGSSSRIIQKVITGLGQVIPALGQYKEDVTPTVKNIINTLKGNAGTTAQQLDELDKLDAQCDAIFDEALKNAEGEDTAANDGTGPAKEPGGEGGTGEGSQSEGGTGEGSGGTDTGDETK